MSPVMMKGVENNIVSILFLLQLLDYHFIIIIKQCGSRTENEPLVRHTHIPSPQEDGFDDATEAILHMLTYGSCRQLLF